MIFDRFLRTEQLAAARRELGREPERRREHRRRSRELARAAEELAARDLTGEFELARSALHREGLRLALHAFELERGAPGPDEPGPSGSTAAGAGRDEPGFVEASSDRPRETESASAGSSAAEPGPGELTAAEPGGDRSSAAAQDSDGSRAEAPEPAGGSADAPTVAVATNAGPTSSALKGPAEPRLTTGVPVELRALRARLEHGDGAAMSLAELAAAHLWALGELERAQSAVDAALAARAIRLGFLAFGAAAAALALSVFVGWALSPRDLARGKPWRTSSTTLVCEPDKHLCGGTRTDIFFHTATEMNPWLEIDLGAPTAFSRLSIQNRRDQGVNRATPLAVEVGDDQQTWRTVATRDAPFSLWEPTFPQVTARYVRLRVMKRSLFHLEWVKVHR